MFGSSATLSYILWNARKTKQMVEYLLMLSLLPT